MTGDETTERGKEMRLPKWAQERLEYLRRRLREANEELRVLRDHGVDAGRPHVGVGLDTVNSGPKERYPLQTQVTFQLGDSFRDVIEVRATGDLKRGEYALRVQAGVSRIAVEPQAANVVRVRLVED